MTKDELAGQVAHLRNALEVLHREAGRDWLEGVKSDSALDALEYASRTLKATIPQAMSDHRPGFDGVDLASMTVVELAEYLSQLQMTITGVDNAFVLRAYKLRIGEVEARIGEVEREIAVHNARETARQEGRDYEG